MFCPGMPGRHRATLTNGAGTGKELTDGVDIIAGNPTSRVNGGTGFIDKGMERDPGGFHPLKGGFPGRAGNSRRNPV